MSANINAAGFAIQETSGSGLGQAFAGWGAQTQDVSGVWNNAAIAPFLSGKFNAAVQGSLVLPKAQFTNTGSTLNVLNPANGQTVSNLATGPNGDGGKTAFVPSLYATYALGEMFTVGVSVTAPVGLATKYDANWIGRFKAVESDLKTINITPFVAIKVHKNIAVSFGAVAQYADIKLTSKINNSRFGGAGEGDIVNKGTDWGFGYTIGLMFRNLWEGFDLGFQYRSRVRHDLSGTRTVSGVNSFVAPQGLPAAQQALANALQAGAAASVNNANIDNGDLGIAAALDTPTVIGVFMSQKFNDFFTMFATAQWTQWSALKEIKITAPSRVTANGGVVGAAEPLLWANSWFLSLGAEMKFNEAFTGRLGVAYDQTPTHGSTRSPRLAGDDRWWLSAGVDYNVNENWKLSLSYTHVFVKDTSVMTGNAFGNVVGDYKSSVDIIGFQASYKM